MQIDKRYSNINAYAAHVHGLNRKWWYDLDGAPIASTWHLPTRFNLMLSEVSEGFEAYRKDQKDDHLPQYPGLWAEMADVVIRLLDSACAFGWHLEDIGHLGWFIPTNTNDRLFKVSDHIMYLAHVVIDAQAVWAHTPGQVAMSIINQCEMIAVTEGCEDFWQVVYDKLVFNWSRPDHSYAARAAAGGKKF